MKNGNQIRVSGFYWYWPDNQGPWTVVKVEVNSNTAPNQFSVFGVAGPLLAENFNGEFGPRLTEPPGL